MTDFKPTWLYIKQHNKTGLKYFGKTVQKDPYRYIGSGVYWRNHLKIYGKDISTIWCEKFYDEETLVEFALFVSEELNIVSSNKWANLMEENGLDGGFKTALNKGRIHTEEARKNMCIGHKNMSIEQKQKRALKISLKNKGRIQPEAEKLKQSIAQKGRKYSQETNSKRNAANTGKIRSEETRQKISAAGLGRNVSEETRLKISNTLKLRKQLKKDESEDNYEN